MQWSHNTYIVLGSFHVKSSSAFPLALSDFPYSLILVAQTSQSKVCKIISPNFKNWKFCLRVHLLPILEDRFDNFRLAKNIFSPVAPPTAKIINSTDSKDKEGAWQIIFFVKSEWIVLPSCKLVEAFPFNIIAKYPLTKSTQPPKASQLVQTN